MRLEQLALGHGLHSSTDAQGRAVGAQIQPRGPLDFETLLDDDVDWSFQMCVQIRSESAVRATGCRILANTVGVEEQPRCVVGVG